MAVQGLTGADTGCEPLDRSVKLHAPPNGQRRFAVSRHRWIDSRSESPDQADAPSGIAVMLP